MGENEFELVRLPNGAHSVRFSAYSETLHPVAGPAAEAEALYVRQLRLENRFAAAPDEFVIWDVGLGAGANAMTVLRGLSGITGRVRLVSVDHTLEPLKFAVRHAGSLGYFGEWGAVAERVAAGERDLVFTAGKAEVRWQVYAGSFPQWIASDEWNHLKDAGRKLTMVPPQAVLFDPFSPARNPEMWTIDVFQALFRLLNRARPCALATYSRTTFVRVSLLLAGFVVGIGESVAGKEETTVAANDPGLIVRPLDRRWLERARRSHSAEPLREPVYRQAPLSPEAWARLQAHPQFQ